MWELEEWLEIRETEMGQGQAWRHGRRSWESCGGDGGTSVWSELSQVRGKEREGDALAVSSCPWHFVRPWRQHHLFGNCKPDVGLYRT